MNASSLNSVLGLPAATSPTPDEVAEAELVRRARRDCPDAFRSLVKRHQQRVYHFCYQYLRDPRDAQEACQDTFVRAHAALHRYRPRARFSTWLFRIALNLCRDRIRSLSAAKHRPTAPLDDDAEGCACGRARPDEAAMHGADLARLQHGLAALPEKLRDVLVLHCLDNLSHAECAEILRCSERAVEGRLYRARQQLTAWWETDHRP